MTPSGKPVPAPPAHPVPRADLRVPCAPRYLSYAAAGDSPVAAAYLGVMQLEEIFRPREGTWISTSRRRPPLSDGEGPRHGSRVRVHACIHPPAHLYHLYSFVRSQFRSRSSLSGAHFCSLSVLFACASSHSLPRSVRRGRGRFTGIDTNLPGHVKPSQARPGPPASLPDRGVLSKHGHYPRC
jgi:hypothetical protein